MNIVAKVGLAALVAAGSLTSSTPASALTQVFASYIPVRTGSNVRYNKIGVDNGSFFTISAPGATTPGATNVLFNFVGTTLPSLGVLNASFFSVSTAIDNPALSVGGLLIQSIDSGSFAFTYTGAAPLTVGTHTYLTGANLLSGTYTNGSIFGTRQGSSGSAVASTPIGVVTYTSDFLTFDSSTNKDFSLALTALTPFLTRVDTDSSIGSFSAASAGVFSNELAAVPDPQVWALLVAGFSLVGFRVRVRRHAKTAVTC